MAAEEPLKKLEEQLNCSICLDTYTDPKQNHVFCQKCLVKLVIRDQQGQLSLTCPNCRQVTPVPASGTRGLQAAFQSNQLLEIYDSFKRIREAPVSVEGAVGGGTSSLNPVKKTSYCSEHSEKELELYCETCGKLICCYCAIKSGKHHTHNYELLSNAYEKYSKEIASSFGPMEKQLTTINRALVQLNIHSEKITDQQASIETDIHNTVRRLREILRARETSLVNQLHQITQGKLKELAVQKDQLETTQAQLSSCLEFMKESLKTSSQGEVLRMKTTIVKQVKELTTIQPDTLQPDTKANVVFSTIADFSTTCQNFGKLSIRTSPDPSSSIAIACDTPNFVVGGLLSPWGVTSNHKGEILISEGGGHCISVFSPSGEKVLSFGTHGSGQGQFITPRGMAVDSEGNILVVDRNNHCIQKFTASGQFLRAIGAQGSGPLQFEYPKDLIINPKNNRVYVVDENNRVQILNSDLSFFSTFGTSGIEAEQFQYPCGIACDSSGNVYVADSGNGRAQVFSAEGEFVRMFTGSLACGWGNSLRMPIGIAVDNGLVYMSEYFNHCVSVFTSVGQFVTSFGRHGHGLGEFNCPGSLAVAKGVLYVWGHNNNRVQAFALH